ncbi:MAG: hypothetical protein AAF039_08790 [Bacteroidota bacterium]
MIKDEAFESALVAILFGFSAFLMMYHKEWYSLGGLLAMASLIMIMDALSIRNKKPTYKKYQ